MHANCNCIGVISSFKSIYLLDMHWLNKMRYKNTPHASHELARVEVKT